MRQLIRDEKNVPSTECYKGMIRGTQRVVKLSKFSGKNLG